MNTSRHAPTLPVARGELSAAVIDALRSNATPLPLPQVAGSDPYGEDLTLALTVCYELHYRGFAGVSPAWEWNPVLLSLRADLEQVFLDAIREEVTGGEAVTEALDDVITPDDAPTVAEYLRHDGTWEQMRELFTHRSIYHLKEADPHAWVIPRLHGKAKAALVAVEFDEYGGGHPDRMHSTLFADLLDAAHLDSGYLAHLDSVPAPALATVNLMSLLGLHQGLRGALVGALAIAEIGTAPSASRILAGLRRLHAPQACAHFYAEHVEADSVHEQVMRHDVVGALLTDEPDLAADVVFGAQATNLVEDRLATHLLDNWHTGRTSLRTPLPAAHTDLAVAP